MLHRSPRILLLQARTADDPMARHELEAFATQCDLDLDAFATFNIATTPARTFPVEGYDAVMVGGAGAFSLVEGGFDWHRDFLDLTRRLIEARVPMFASCFGFQAIVQALGGTLERDPERAELGTFPIELTEQGHSDPLFGELPEVFDAQLGHNDSAITLPDELVHLASSERCVYQAVRVRGRPVIATQFHPELGREGNLDRFRNYLNNYKPEGQTFEEAMAYAERIHRPSPHACGLLKAFVADVALHIEGRRALQAGDV
ncbi:type 1 glutamine amidotransferase [Lujinxingia sediminis]|uniref:Type 1 glutamine amidotransferase n=1 Tax=Lujinxingia sediminis TaxID=2480984 RepID=A0ABY0CTJ6_9DELT|nr:type 1 glutamine amidotransferase [Lujinxingia sediminis]RVU44860.1 type 1 glutamine amidotransferase [Lujinxingia sediminis]